MPAPISGHVDPKFISVREAFAGNFAQHGERGAAVAVFLDGRPVVDIWGGHRNAAGTDPWQRDTMVNFFSVSKALCAVAAMQLVDDRRLDLDAPVSRHWPEFAQAGKEEITARHILCHQAGLPAIREALPDGSAVRWSVITGALARTEPWWTPGTAHGYHVNTFGFLVGELVRRITGKSIGTHLRERIAGPLGADVFIGVPAAEHHRIAEYLWPNAGGSSPSLDRSQGTPTPDQVMRFNTYWNPPGFSGAAWVNRPEWRSAEVPSTNGHGTARGVARVYAALARGGEIDDTRILSKDAIRQAATEHSCGMDLINERPSRFGLGFQLTQSERPLGPNKGAFGHFGAGGSLGYCDPEAGIAFAYVTNDMGPRWQNPRNRALIDAVYASFA
jgi:CubicO group peptidase (beta-lactamase class C family)